VSQVLYVKETSLGSFVVIDAGMNNLIRPALYNSYHQILPIIKHPARRKRRYFIVGPLCEEADFFFPEEIELEEVNPKEKLAIMNTGAYGSSMASNYNSRALAPELLVESNKFRIIRRRQSYEDYIALESNLTN
jgi:diaminopimelate decarboxylase